MFGGWVSGLICGRLFVVGGCSSDLGWVWMVTAGFDADVSLI